MFSVYYGDDDVIHHTTCGQARLTMNYIINPICVYTVMTMMSYIMPHIYSTCGQARLTMNYITNPICGTYTTIHITSSPSSPSPSSPSQSPGRSQVVSSPFRSQPLSSPPRHGDPSPDSPYHLQLACGHLWREGERREGVESAMNYSCEGA